jgi:hypothetical protein
MATTKELYPSYIGEYLKALLGCLLLRLLFFVSCYCFMYACFFVQVLWFLNDSPSAQTEIYQFAALWISACVFCVGSGGVGWRERMIPPLTVVRRILVGINWCMDGLGTESV